MQYTLFWLDHKHDTKLTQLHDLKWTNQRAPFGGVAPRHAHHSSAASWSTTVLEIGHLAGLIRS